jgi:hypothetical protein
MTEKRRSQRGARGGDPLGKRALFSPPPEARRRKDPRPPAGVSDGVHALYSAAPAAARVAPEPPRQPRREDHAVELECSGCGVRTGLSLADAGLRMVAFSPWTMWTGYSQLLNCPACYQWRWCRVRWMGSVP